MKKTTVLYGALGLILMMFSGCVSVEMEPFSIDEYGLATRQKDSMTKIQSEEFGLYSRAVKFAKIIEPTDTIQTKLGDSFGYIYTVKGSPRGMKIDLKIVGEVPELTNPKTGKTFSTYSYDVKGVIGEDYYQGYTFDHEWELIPGDWTLKVLYQNEVMASQTFYVVE